MGNSPSRSRHSVDISGPRTLAPAAAAAASEMVETRHTTNQIGRRATTSTSTPTRTSSTPHTHRRARSTNFQSENTAKKSRESAPPPYSPYGAMNARPYDNVEKITAPSPPASSTAGSAVGTPHRRYSALPNLGAISENSPRLTVNTSVAGAAENVLEVLREYNTVIIVDDSSSMAGEAWRETREALAALAEIASKYDADGIDVCFLNDRRVGRNMTDAGSVNHLFQTVTPSGATPLAAKLDILTLFYMDQLDKAKAAADAGDQRALRAVKPINYIIITDGSPTDEPSDVIVRLAKRLDAGNYPLSQFVQIGNNPKATEFLTELDDDLSRTHGVRDIVDTTPYTGGVLTAELMIKMLLGGINRRVDRRGARSVMSQ
ncbi:hypothetical protein NLI96_g8229 [Meripilus lineatus]|uniref:VWFA domain-containing protein n=1 Tax=Meripilus lineatus TaxID=2056292 RepID=A0AAD5UXX0_9APHY|nr:hypothetical protein NLI96_g8229 [Physisporinus lineatus]